MDKTEITIKAYDRSAEKFQEKFMDLKLYISSFEYLDTLVNPGSKILDLGCGPGNVIKFLYDKNKSYNITGVDLSGEMIRLAKKNNPYAAFQLCDIRKIDFKESEFDLIISAFCLPFLYNEETEELIEKISKYLKKGGLLYLSTMEGKGSRFERPSFCKEHDMFFNYYEEKFLKKLFKKNKLNLIKYFRLDYLNKNGSLLKDMIFILRK